MVPNDYIPLKLAICQTGMRVIRPSDHFDPASAHRSPARAIKGVVHGDPEKRNGTWYVPVLRDDTNLVDWIALTRLKINGASINNAA